MASRYKYLLECVFGLVLACLMVYGIAVSVDDIEFVYRNY